VVHVMTTIWTRNLIPAISQLSNVDMKWATSNEWMLLK
jgi:hypothetical protein